MTASACKPVVSMRLRSCLSLLAVAIIFATSPVSIEAATDVGRTIRSDWQRNQDSSENGDEGKPTRTPRSRDRTPTPITNEVWGLPTQAIDSNGDGGPDAPTPTATVNRTPTVRPTATIAPTTSEDGTVSSQIGPDGGPLESPFGASLDVPAGALTEVSTVSIQPVADTKLPVQEQVDLIPGSGFDISIAGPDGRAIEQIAEPAEFRIEIDEDQMSEGVRLYRVDGSELVALPNTRIDGNELVITVSSASRIVAGVPSPTSANPTRGALPFILAAVVVVIVLVGMVVLGGMFRPRRQRVVVTRRPPRQRSKYR